MRPRRAARSRWLVVLTLALLILAAAGCRRKTLEADAGEAPDLPTPPTTPAPLSTAVPPPCADAPGSFAELTARLAPNVVTLFGDANAAVDTGPRSALPLAWAETTPHRTTAETAEAMTPLGTGFLLEAGTHVITSRRVLGRATTLAVELRNGERRSATLRGTDQELDIALLLLEDPVTDALPLVSAARPRPGDWVAVIGDAFGNAPSVTAGVVRFSQRPGPLSEERPQMARLYGVDATIDAANWGGPVVDASGGLIGLATASPRAGSRVGLVVPADRLRRVVGQLAQHGHPARVWIGLWVRPLDQDRAQELDIEPPRGLLVSRVAPSGPAQEAGLEPNDVIVEFAGQPVSTPGELGTLATSSEPDQPIPLVVIRDGRPRSLRLRPAPMPQ